MDKYNWIAEELLEEGFDVTASEVQMILSGNVGDFSLAVVDIITELDREWAED